MRAILAERYGSPEVLQMHEIGIPEPKDKDLLIKINTTTVSAGDWRIRKADPFIIRFFSGLTKPKKPILGHELSGEIVKTGDSVTKFKVGDKVFGTTGTGSGTYAEYISISEDSPLSKLPDNLSIEKAPSLTVGALTALHFLKKANIQKGQKILIHGASGSVGSSAVQLAKYYGAEVTAVAGTHSVDLLKAIGADKIIDYKKQDFTKVQEKYDILFNVVGKTSYKAVKEILKNNGVYIASDAPLSDYLAMMNISKKKGHQVIAGLSDTTQEDQLLISSIIEQGRLKPVIDREYSLEDIADAHRYVEKGHKKGTVLIRIENEKVAK